MLDQPPFKCSRSIITVQSRGAKPSIKRGAKQSTQTDLVTHLKDRRSFKDAEEESNTGEIYHPSHRTRASAQGNPVTSPGSKIKTLGRRKGEMRG